MAAHGDHTAYVVARWPVLVRSLVAEGVDVGAAEAAVAEALARLRRGWSRLASAEDVDARVWSEVRDAAGLPPDEPGAVAPLLLDAGPRDGVDDVEVSGDPLGAVAARRARRRRRAWAAGGAAVLACVLVAAYLGWATSRSPEPEVVRAANPAPVPWYAEGLLHLEDVVVALPRLESFVATGGDEVAFVDTAGRWFSVDRDGRLTETTEPDDATAIGGAGGFRFSPDRRHVLRLVAGIVSAYDVEGDTAIDPGTGPDVRVLDAAFAEDGTVTYVLSNLTQRRLTDTTVRLSETGTLALRTCTLEPLACRDVVRLSGTAGALRLR